jgi:N-acyl-D-aspartate/D-glutamate deacylase
MDKGVDMLDYAITGGTVVDGTGAAGFRANVGIKDGRIVEVGELQSEAARTVPADGLVVGPGFIDPHTHYDAQLFWDPSATPSCWHGVTTVIAGNCGFTLAPLKDRDADYIRRMMAQVEGMPLSGLEQGVPWSWESFAQYLDALDGTTAVNAGFLVGHSALRRYVLGEDFGRDTNEEERTQMRQVLDQSLAAGGLGLSTSRSYTHTDGEGDPVPSRWASEEELFALCEVVGRHDGMSLALITAGCIERFDDHEVEYLARLSEVARSPINWNALGISSQEPERVEHQLRPSRRAREIGGRIMALTMPVWADNNVSFLTFCRLWHIPGWREVLDLDVAEKMRRLQDPTVRQQLLEKALASRWAMLVDFSHYTVGDVFSESNAGYRNRMVGDIAAERGEDPFTTIVNIVVADELRTVLWPPPFADTEADWKLRRDAWEDPEILIGGSDAGAHIDRMLGSTYPTRFLADCIRGRQLLPMERAVQLMTDVPARLFGLRDRGRVAVGQHADIVVFDPERVGAGPVRTTHDLPGGGKRLIADPEGVAWVSVNGREAIVDGRRSGDLAGTLLRSGRDTSASAR